VTDIKIIASPDFEEQTAEVAPLLESLMLGIRSKGGTESEKLDLKENLESVTVQSEDEVRSLLGATGWGLLGSYLLGPAGLLLGALWGWRKQKEVCFAGYLKDGRKFLGITDAQTFQKLKAVSFR
jgi:hypothetical protein